MIEPGKTYVVMGLLDTESLAWTIGRTLQGLGARVVYTFQNEVLKKRYFDSGRTLSAADG
jgi:enoyl-[acyl-carrier-protein] reductase (NADH)